MEDIIMILTEDRNTTINFHHKSCSIEYYKDTKVIYVRFKSAKEVYLFKHIMTTKYADIFEIEINYHTAIVKLRDTTTITNLAILDNKSYLSISLNYTYYLKL